VSVDTDTTNTNTNTSTTAQGANTMKSTTTTSSHHRLDYQALTNTLDLYIEDTPANRLIFSMLERDATEFEYTNRQLADLSHEIIHTATTVVDAVANNTRAIYAAHVAGKAIRLAETQVKWEHAVDNCCRLMGLLKEQIADQETADEFRRDMNAVLFGYRPTN
jgi:hypothetical protein